MNPNLGESLNPIGSTTTSTCAPESNLLSDTQPMVSDDEPSNRTGDAATVVGEEQAVSEEALKETQMEEIFCQLASELASSFPQIPTERILKRSLAFGKAADVWVQDEATFFETIVDTYTDQALALVTEHKNLEDEVSAKNIQIVQAANSVASEFTKIKELMVRLEAIKKAKSGIAGKQRLLESLKREIDDLRKAQVPVAKSIKEGGEFLEALKNSD